MLPHGGNRGNMGKSTDRELGEEIKKSISGYLLNGIKKDPDFLLG